jgi:hypothetical protein
MSKLTAGLLAIVVSVASNALLCGTALADEKAPPVKPNPMAAMTTIPFDKISQAASVFKVLQDVSSLQQMLWDKLVRAGVDVLSGNAAHLLSENQTHLLSGNAPQLFSGNEPKILSGNKPKLLSDNQTPIFSGNSISLFSNIKVEVHIEISDSQNNNGNNNGLPPITTAPAAGRQPETRRPSTPRP